ncbi:AAA family ATPase [Duganella vulcania]|uniref:AAA domain-containing protein n=1 Tax=Duganella vulcania TaxID=2692166 RepID=A0A845GGU8_9BURK|nr:AAA family ATPase [Duganella vulcania]MYM92740.1 AAA domain-containing protein [Duganella vulcania]
MHENLIKQLGVTKTALFHLMNAINSGKVVPEDILSKFDEAVHKSQLLESAVALPQAAVRAVDSKSAAQRRDEFIKMHAKQPKEFDASVLGINGFPLPLKGYAEPNAFVPREGSDYVLRPDLLRVMIAWLLGGSMDSCLHFFGPTGSGKTSFARRVAELLNIPVLSYTCNQDTDMDHLLGHYVVNESGGMVWKDGPVTLAVRAGWWVQLNEMDYASPAVLAGLNDIMEGRGFYLTATNEFIEFHPDARIMVTSNTSGMGDQTGGSYVGTQQQNLAFLDRLESIPVDYMDSAAEVSLVQMDLGPLANILPELAPRLVKVATQIRAQYMGENAASSALEVTMSTRALRRWARKILLFKNIASKGEDPIQFALGLALTNKCTRPTQHAIANLVTAEVGAWASLTKPSVAAAATGT